MMTTRDPDPDTLAPTEPGNPYPDETISLNAMPEECPLLILPYGLLSEKILHLVKQKRRDLRENRKDFLIKKTKNDILTMCLIDIHNQSRSVLDLRSQLTKLASKRGIKQLIDHNDIPLIYLEEAYQKQQNPPKLEVNDWVKCTDPSPKSYGRSYYGVVTGVLGRNRVRVQYVATRSGAINSAGDVLPAIEPTVYEDESGTSYKKYPLFHKWQTSYFEGSWKPSMRNDIIGIEQTWRCEAIGHDTPEWKKLREKCIQDGDINYQKREQIWDNVLLSLLKKEVFYKGDHSVPDWTHPEYRRLWFHMEVNVLDKTIWTSGYDEISGKWRCPQHPLPPPVRDYYSGEYMRNLIMNSGILD